MKRKKRAFTLAEVLITLGIIGVVAAMTIPTLITNVKGARIRTQFKKSISTLNQAAKMNLAQYDWDFGAMTSDGSGGDECGDSGTRGANHNPESDITMCALFNANLTGKTILGNYDYDSATHGYVMNDFNGGSMRIGSGAWFVLYQLADGAIVGINRHPNGCTRNSYLGTGGYAPLCTGWIDVNGKNLPNTEIQCTDPSKTKAIWEQDYEECIVKVTGNTGDVFPIAFYDSTVVPATNAGKYILNTAK